MVKKDVKNYVALLVTNMLKQEVSSECFKITQWDFGANSKELKHNIYVLLRPFKRLYDQI